MRRDLVPALLRLDRLDAALPRSSRRDLALDGRRDLREAVARAGAPRARVDRPLRRPRRRRLRRVQPRGRQRAREPVVEGLRRLAALPGRLVRRAPIAAVEVQGYVYDAKRGLAEVAREVWRDRRSPSGSSGRRRSSGRGSTRRSGSRSAAASTRSRSTGRSGESTRDPPTWAISCGAGSSLPERVGTVVDQLLSEGLWTGWGIRTMASDAAAFNPISYHNGTVWPHDTALAAWGLARHGYTAEARRIGRALIEAAAHFDWSLPEVFAGLRARGDAVPDRVPDRCSPAGLGRGHADPARPHPPRDRAGPGATAPRLDRDRRASELARRAEHRRRSRVRADVDGCGRARPCNHCRRCLDEGRPRLPGVVPGPAGGVRRDGAGRRAARRRARRRGPRRDAVRVG